MCKELRENLLSPIIEYVWNKKSKKEPGKPLNRKKIGVMVAGINPDNHDEIRIGYSLCNTKLDKFDHVNWNGAHLKVENFGKKLAVNRAIKWQSRLYATSTNQYKSQERNMFFVHIPQSIHKDLKKFIRRAARYYQGARLPQWAEGILRLE